MKKITRRLLEALDKLDNSFVGAALFFAVAGLCAFLLMFC